MRTLIILSLMLSSSAVFAQELEDLDPGLYAHFETTAGEFTIELFHEKAPETVGNFVNLATGRQDWRHPVTGEVHAGKPYYEGIIFHRVITGFMIQTGDPSGTGTGGPGYTIADEFGDGLRHSREGMVSMANRGPNTGSSQFFITLAATRHLDGKHAIFGRVIKGLGVIRKIGRVQTHRRTNKPVRDITINKVRILRVPSFE